MEDRQEQKTMTIILEPDMFQGFKPSATAATLLAQLVREIVTTLNGVNLERIELAVTGYWDRQEGKDQAKAKEGNPR